MEDRDHSLEIDDKYIELLLKLYNKLAAYHDYKVFGLENIPMLGSGLVVMNHSLATYDMFLLSAYVYLKKDRLVRPLIDRLFFKIGPLGEIMAHLGARKGSQENAESLLNRNELVTVSPGGMKEALRPSKYRYQLRWENRKGFIRLAIQTQSPIILAACPKADDIYSVFDTKLTKWAYQNFKIPLVLARGLGPSPMPKPVALAHFIDKPIQPPKLDDKYKEDPDKVIDQFHRKVTKRMEALMFKGINYRPTD